MEDPGEDCTAGTIWRGEQPDNTAHNKIQKKLRPLSQTLLRPSNCCSAILVTSTRCCERSFTNVVSVLDFTFSSQLCPDARRGRQPTRCGRDSAPPHFTLERAICPQRPGGVWLLSTTMYISSPEVTSIACVCVLLTVFPCVRRTRSLVCAALIQGS